MARREIATLAQKEPPQYLSRSQVETLIAAIPLRGAAGPRLRMLATVLWNTGARISEALALVRSDIDLENRRIRLRTLKRQGDRRRRQAELHRWVPISDALAADLAIWLHSQGAAEPGLKLFPMDRSSAYRAIRRAADRSGLVARGGRRVSPHILRHSYGAHLQGSGVPLPVIQRLMGHAWISSTLVYTRVADAEIKQFLKGVEF